MSKGLLYVLVGAAMLLVLSMLSTVWVADASSDDQKQKMALYSPAFEANSDIPKRFSCQGESVSPPLKWSGVPKDAKSLALIVDDPDAPSGTYVHWVVYNLAPDSGGLDEGAAKQLPTGAVTADNSAHEQTYHGMCPPSGQHHYRFKLYALNTRLDEDQKNKAAVRAAIKGHVLAHTKLIATYAKQ